jgi:hypothetical protein
MKKVIKLTESELNNIIKKVIAEQFTGTERAKDPYADDSSYVHPEDQTDYGLTRSKTVVGPTKGTVNPAPVGSPIKTPGLQPNKTTVPTPVKTTPVSKTNPTILKAQKYLNKLGYNLGNSGTGKNGVDGKNGPMTRTAISTFQRENKLPQTGIADAKTLEVMNNAYNKKFTTGVLKPTEPTPTKNDPVKFWNNPETANSSNPAPAKPAAPKKKGWVPISQRKYQR